MIALTTRLYRGESDLQAIADLLNACEMDRLKAAGMEMAKLGVDAQNPNGAKQLYESVGFGELYTSIAYVKDIGK
jgi:hypothetical protein